MSLPSHFVTMAVLAGIAQSEISPASLPQYKRRFIPVIVIALLLPFCLFRQGQRLAAEYYQKEARRRAESGMTSVGASTWQLIEQQFLQTLFSQAGPPQQLREALESINQLAQYRLTGAKELFQKSVNADRGYTNASSRLASLYLWSGDYESAYDTYRLCLRN